MKKLLIITMLAISMVAFAKSSEMSNSGMMQQSGGNMGTSGGMTQQTNINARGKTMQSFNTLNREQQLQLQQMQLKYQNELQKDVLAINELGLEIEKEMMAEKVNTQKIGKLIDKKAAAYSRMEKNMIEYRIKVIEKFGMDVSDGMMMGSSLKIMGGMNQAAGDMDIIMSNMNQIMNDMNIMMNNVDRMLNNMNRMQNAEQMPEYQK